MLFAHRKGGLMLAAKEIERISNSLGRRVTAKELVRFAANKTSPLHRYFQWNDTRAAKEYRVQQAHQLIIRVYVRIVNADGDKSKMRAFHDAIIWEGERQIHAYVPLPRIKEEPDLMRQVVNKAMQEARSWADRYRQYSRLRKIVVAIDKSDPLVPKKKK